MWEALRWFFIYEIHLEHWVSLTMMEEVSAFWRAQYKCQNNTLEYAGAVNASVLKIWIVKSNIHTCIQNLPQILTGVYFSKLIFHDSFSFIFFQECYFSWRASNVKWSGDTESNTSTTRYSIHNSRHIPSMNACN